MNINSSGIFLRDPDEGARRSAQRALTRRTFVGASLAATGLAAPMVRPASARASTRPMAPPFTLGVASGDPTSTGVVLWTRLAPDPLAEDGSGGAPSRDVRVQWELSSDPRMRGPVRRGTVAAGPAWGHSVHVEVEGLEPARDYYYRFRAEGHPSPVGRTRTAPAPDSAEPLTMAAVSCAHWEGGYFTAYQHIADERPDLVFGLGDYIYEGGPVAGRVRQHLGPSCTTLADYRRRYALYKAEPETRAAHQAAPWVVTWDDHEIADNWASIYPAGGVPSDVFERRRAAATQAFYENLPLRRSSMPSGPDIQLFRRVRWGRTATFHVLDTRQYRSDQACGDGWRADCADRLDPARTLTGDRQEAWLLDGLATSPGTWQVIPQQIFFCQRDITQGPVQTLGMDQWDGYTASRNRIRDGWVERGVRNTVLLSGDVHANFANEVKTDFDDPASATVGVEFVGTSVTSGGNGNDSSASGERVLAENPHLKFYNSQRGYLRVLADPDGWRTDFRVMPYVEQRGAPISTRRSYALEPGSPGLHQV